MPEHPRTETQCLSLHGKPSCGLCRINCPSSPHRILPSYCFILWREHRNHDRSCVCVEDVCVDLERHATVIFFLKFIGTNSLPISRRALPQWGRPQLSTHAPSRRADRIDTPRPPRCRSRRLTKCLLIFKLFVPRCFTSSVSDILCFLSRNITLKTAL